jgi:cobalamin synthase
VPEGYVPVGWNGVPRPPRVDGLAIAALLCGAGGLLCFITPVLGIIFGLVSRSRIKGSNGDLTGSGLALAGVIVSSVMLALVALTFAVGRFLSA